MDKYQRQIRIFLAVISVILIAAVMKVSSSISVNLILALFIYIFFLPLCVSMERANIPSYVATVLSVLLMIVVVFVAAAFTIYAADLLIRTLPEYGSRLVAFDRFLVGILRRWMDLPPEFSILGVMNIDWIGGVILPALKTISGSAISIVKNMFLTILMSVFLLAERNSIVKKISDVSRPDKRERVATIFDRIYRQISKYISLKLLISIATGLLFYAICYYVKLDFALLIGVSAFMFNFIPTIGSIVITIVTIFVAILQFLPNWTPVIIVSVGTILTQMILGNIIDPRLQGSQLNLSPFVILVSLSVFGFIWGIIGTFLAVPILSVLEIILANMESTKGIALILSSGSSYKRKKRQENSQEQPAAPYEDVMLPDEKRK